MTHNLVSDALLRQAESGDLEAFASVVAWTEARTSFGGPDGGPDATMQVQELSALARRTLSRAASQERPRSVYLPMDCPVCGRHRVEWDGKVLRCEKCTTSSEWDGFTTERYGSQERPSIDVERLAALLRDHCHDSIDEGLPILLRHKHLAPFVRDDCAAAIARGLSGPVRECQRFRHDEHCTH